MKKAYAIAFISTLATLAFTSSWALNPTKCPSVSAIQATDFVQVSVADGKFVAFQFSSYDTTEPWGFAVYNINASSPSDAMNKAKAALAVLTFKEGPILSHHLGVYACKYDIGAVFKAKAITSKTSLNLADILVK